MNSPQLGDYRAVQTSDECFIVQCWCLRTTVNPRRNWLGWLYQDIEERGYWRTIRDNTKTKWGAENMPPPLHFPTLELAQAFVTKLREDLRKYPIYHDLN